MYCFIEIISYVYENCSGFFHSSEALDHEVDYVVVGIGVGLHLVLASEEHAPRACGASLTLQRLHLGLTVL